MKKKCDRKAGGFTLIELVVVILIIGLLAGLVAPQVMKQFSKATQSTAKEQIANFETALDAFRLDVSRYPTTEEGLKALNEKPSGAEGWAGPYLKKVIPLDPWGKPYFYKCPGDHGEYDLWSYGRDKAEGGTGEDQDVTSWGDLPASQGTTK
jgi:general secretion pathway protein G